MKKLAASLLLVSGLAVAGPSLAGASTLHDTTQSISPSMNQLSSHFVSPSSAHLTKTYVKNGVTNISIPSAGAQYDKKQVIGEFTPNNAIKLSIKGWQMARTSDAKANVDYILYRNGSPVDTQNVYGDIKQKDTNRWFYKVFKNWSPGVKYTVYAQNKTSVPVNLGLDAYWDTAE
ncbi:hypothetical protein P9D31_20070 [Bacillus haynesii]|uniref:hypothetical protein n=1 Tax=Bacillus haynesii TaxID=1925021 RepID=UPI002DB97E97|nr:hypothetical protein [Bacillus haynesii]MEC1347722.1 hypothetical protein [Bacillus haynesii]MEC1474625.1 hypothetical protein [Bacillus haynesii]MEC1476073.1 hypothetical protein [Bacillus haynesii]MEC1485949.1 hypothetical protein [Bacillus haynesii]MEC1561654.1 hypothetical protein [Bacillus haynesii]